MAEVLAGFVCGYGLSLVLTPVLALAFVRARSASPELQRAPPLGVTVAGLAAVLHLFLFLVLTALGIVLGLALGGLEDRSPEGGLGSPTGAFTALVLSIAGIAVLPLAVAAPRLRLPLLAAGLLFAGVFGWLMPYLALWAPDRG